MIKYNYENTNIDLNIYRKLHKRGNTMSYFYQFLEPVSKELAKTLQELEGAIYTSPRSMLTHSRTLIEALMEKVMVHEHMDNEP